jgi:hypothetical protein
MVEEVACRSRAAGRKTRRTGGAADTLPVPGGELGDGESIDGTDYGDGNDASVEPTRFDFVMLPDEMENDRVIRGIEMVTVISPAAGAEVDLDATGAKLTSVEEDERVAKIRPQTVTPGAAVNDLQRNAVGRGKAPRYRTRMPGGAERDLRNPG